MLNRISALLRDHFADAPPHAPPLDWSKLVHWVTPLRAVANKEVCWSRINLPELREDFRRSGILQYDGPEWAEAEGGLGEAINRSATRDLSYVRKALSALYFEDEKDSDYFREAVEIGAMFVLIFRAHTLVTARQVLEELITGVIRSERGAKPPLQRVGCRAVAGDCPQLERRARSVAAPRATLLVRPQGVFTPMKVSV